MFVSPPVFTGKERKKYFSFPMGILEIANRLAKSHNKVYFLLLYGYFKATNKFFNKGFHQNDIEFIALKLGISLEELGKAEYKRRTYLNHRETILSYCGVTKFTSETASFLLPQLAPLVRSQTRPKTILFQSCQLLIAHKMEIPNYNTLSTLITEELKRYQKEVIHVLNKNLANESRKMLDMLLIKEDLLNVPSHRYKLTLMKKFTQSTRPAKVKENIHDLTILKELFQNLQPVTTTLNLASEAVKYYAHCVIKFKMLQMLRRSDEERYLYLFSFIVHQYYSGQDVLIDTLILSVQASLNKVVVDHKENVFTMRKTKSDAITQMVTLVKKRQELFAQLEEILHASALTDEQKLHKVTALVTKYDDDFKPADKLVDMLEKEQSRLAKDSDYYDMVEAQSLRLQNRVSEIVKVVEFDKETSNKNILAAIFYYKQTDGNVTQSAPTDFLDEQEQAAVFDENNKLRVSLYKALLFIHIAALIKSGGLNIPHSYKYRSFDAYLLPKDLWDEQKETKLADTNLAELESVEKTLRSLETLLSSQYEKTNRHILSSKNPYIRFKNSSFYLATPKEEAGEEEGIADLMPKARSIPLLSVLKTVNDTTNFINAFAHFQTKHVGKKPLAKTFFAGIMGLGCNIGTSQLAQISRHINQAELENTVNWYFSIDNLLTANDAIIHCIDRLSVPKLFKKDQEKTHTSSDGQKFAIGVDSLNANHSYKYFGEKKGVSVYSFIDDTHALFYSTVISSSEREAAYVIDGLLYNDVVKSDIHSTDTHGYSEIIFAITHLLGFSFAPRIRNFQEQRLYSFEKRKSYEQKRYPLLPAATIQVDLIMEHWDDILRLIATLKLKETTASQLLKRLSSYSRQHPLYRTLKAFGQIIKSVYLLQYIDDVSLRQAVEKQLNKLESSNKFAKAVFYGNNQEFQQETKEEQLIAEGCKRLIENAIILWNYLYISQKIADTTSDEERASLIQRLKQSSIITWQHINLHGEYDFSEEKMQQIFAFSLPKIYELQVV